jgi:ankyrin repeat protein
VKAGVLDNAASVCAGSWQALNVGRRTAITDLPPNEALERAWAADDTEEVIRALRAGANPDARLTHVPILYSAAILGRDVLVRAILDAGAEVDGRGSEDGSTALMAVATLGMESTHDAILRELIARGAEVDAEDHGGNTALDLAVKSGNLRNATVLLALGARGKKQTLVRFARLREETDRKGERGV